jgi:hypothetical protein
MVQVGTLHAERLALIQSEKVSFPKLLLAAGAF